MPFVFSDGLAQYREVLEPGAAVLLQLGAELQGEDVRARVLHAEPLDDAAAKTQKGLRIFVRDTRPLESIAKRLQMPVTDLPPGEYKLGGAVLKDRQTGNITLEGVKWAKAAAGPARGT